MQQPALAILWQIWSKNRLGLTISAISIATLAALLMLLPIEYRTGVTGHTARMALVPIFFYIMSIFTFADLKLSGPVRLDRYPSRMFSLPLPTRTLVIWPMLYGIVTLAILWILSEKLILRPTGAAAPVLTPAFGLATMVALFQAISWAPFASPTTRVLAGGFLAPFPLLFALRASIAWRWSDVSLAFLLLTFMGMAFLMAWAGVTLDRTGEHFKPEQRIMGWLRRFRRERQHPFTSANTAQAWYHWRLNGLLLPGTTLLLLIFLFAPIWIFKDPGTEKLKLPAAALVLTSAIWIPWLVGAGLAKPRFWSGAYSLPEFLATRPMSAYQLYLAQIRASAFSLAITWLLMALLLPLWIWLSGDGELILQLLEILSPTPSIFGMVALGALLLASAYALSFGLMAGGLTAGFTGRQGLVVGDGILKSTGIVACVLLGDWLESNRNALELLPWALAAALAVKGLSAGFVLKISFERGITDKKAIKSLVFLWLAAAGGLAACVFLLVPSGIGPISRTSVSLALLFLLPLVRPALGPMALEWNRCR